MKVNSNLFPAIKKGVPLFIKLIMLNYNPIEKKVMNFELQIRVEFTNFSLIVVM